MTKLAPPELQVGFVCRDDCLHLPEEGEVLKIPLPFGALLPQGCDGLYSGRVGTSRQRHDLEQ